MFDDDFDDKDYGQDDRPVLERCKGERCDVRADRDWFEDGLCPGCAETQACCEHCGVLCEREFMQTVDPKDLVCGPCADKAHAEQETEEHAYSQAVHLEEGWR